MLINNDILKKVFHINTSTGSGTCFVVDDESGQYFVTAKHVLEEFGDGEMIHLYIEGEWKEIQISKIAHSPVADVSVFTSNFYVISPKNEAAMGGLGISQDVFFLGYPFDLRGDSDQPGTTYPLVKKATVSGSEGHGDNQILYLDGMNNPGFSGGPMVYYSSSPDYPDPHLRIGGIISAYRVDRHKGKVNGIDFDYITNSGIIIVVPIHIATNLARSIMP